MNGPDRAPQLPVALGMTRTPTASSAADFCDGMNARLGFDRKRWTAFAERVFAERPDCNGDSGNEPYESPESRAYSPGLCLMCCRALAISISGAGVQGHASEVMLPVRRFPYIGAGDRIRELRTPQGVVPDMP